ncbi:hypothetical protein KIPB_015378, partial [Kipferlia bialata]|eukprot:g15378.t1
MNCGLPAGGKGMSQAAKSLMQSTHMGERKEAEKRLLKEEMHRRARR